MPTKLKLIHNGLSNNLVSNLQSVLFEIADSLEPSFNGRTTVRYDILIDSTRKYPYVYLAKVRTIRGFEVSLSIEYIKLVEIAAHLYPSRNGPTLRCVVYDASLVNNISDLLSENLDILNAANFKIYEGKDSPPS
jgi:hypothetical protein